MLNVKEIEDTFQYFYTKKYGSKKISARTDKTKIIAENFLVLLDKKYTLACLGKNFIWEYFLFQFDYWDGLILTSFNERIALSYIIGKKAFKRYLDRNKEYDWQADSYPIIGKYKLVKSDIDVLFPAVVRQRKDMSMDIRKQYYNTDKGFANCVEFTSLYLSYAPCCIACNFKVDCKELKRVNY